MPWRLPFATSLKLRILILKMTILQKLFQKRARFVLVSLGLGVALFGLSLPPYGQSLGWALLFPVLTWILSFWAFGGLGGIEVLTIPLLPTLVSLGASLGQYFYPNLSLPFKVLSWVAFSAAFYILLLAVNVFLVERQRGEKIPLEKAARPAAFLFAFLAAFLLLTALYKFSWDAYLTTFLVFWIGFLIGLTIFWFYSLTDLLERDQFLGASSVGLLAVQVSLAFSFFPWKAHLRGLSEGVFFYTFLGVARAYFGRHLTYAIVVEYILLALSVFLAIRLLFA